MKVLTVISLALFLTLTQISCVVDVNNTETRKVEGRSVVISDIKFEILDNVQFRPTEKGDCTYWLKIKLSNSSNKEQKIFLEGKGKAINGAIVEEMGVLQTIFKNISDSGPGGYRTEDILTHSSLVMRPQSSLEGWLQLKDDYCSLRKRGYHLDRIEFSLHIHLNVDTGEIKETGTLVYKVIIK